jgi:hypothetical protein
MKFSRQHREVARRGRLHLGSREDRPASGQFLSPMQTPLQSRREAVCPRAGWSGPMDRSARRETRLSHDGELR